MRYAIVTDTYPPEINGVALTVHSLESGLRMRGHDVHVVRPRRPEEAPDSGTLQVASLPLPRYPGLRFGLPTPRMLSRTWTASGPDALYIATEGPLGWSALRVAKKLGIPVATGLHTRFDHYMRDYGAPFLEQTALHWMRRFHNGADATLVPTFELVEELNGKGFLHATRLARGVDASRFDPGLRDPSLRAGWGLRDDDLAVIHVGRIAPEKNLDLAVLAFRAVQRERPDARFIWIGDGPEREALACANPDFVFCGMQRDESLARHFASGDLFLFPSLSETFGNVTLESMASGVPVVAFDYGAAREHLRSGLNGMAVDDSTAFIAAAVALSADDARRLRMGHAAHEAVLHLQPDRVAADFDGLLARLAYMRRHHVHFSAA